MTAKEQYGLKKVLSMGFDDAVEAVTAALKTQGFGILSQIDMQATLKTKLDVDMGKYLILGACNPSLANRALGVEQDVGLLLPCNVIVYEGDTSGETVVSMLNPQKMMSVSDNEGLVAVANDAYDKLEKALAEL